MQWKSVPFCNTGHHRPLRIFMEEMKIMCLIHYKVQVITIFFICLYCSAIIVALYVVFFRAEKVTHMECARLSNFYMYTSNFLLCFLFNFFSAALILWWLWRPVVLDCSVYHLSHVREHFSSILCSFFWFLRCLACEMFAVFVYNRVFSLPFLLKIAFTDCFLQKACMYGVTLSLCSKNTSSNMVSVSGC